MRIHRRIVVVSEHALVREGIAALLRGGGWQVAEAANPQGIRNRPDVAVVDLDHATGDATGLLRQTRKVLPDGCIVAIGSVARLAGCDEVHVDVEVETPRADATLLLAAVRRPVDGSSERLRAGRLWARVTPRQRDVLRLLAAGHDNPTIAERLRVTERAVKAHVSALLEHFGLNNRTQLALVAYRAGLCANGR